MHILDPAGDGSPYSKFLVILLGPNVIKPSLPLHRSWYGLRPWHAGQPSMILVQNFRSVLARTETTTCVSDTTDARWFVDVAARSVVQLTCPVAFSRPANKPIIEQRPLPAPSHIRSLSASPRQRRQISIEICQIGQRPDDSRQSQTFAASQTFPPKTNTIALTEILLSQLYACTCIH